MQKRQQKSKKTALPAGEIVKRYQAGESTAKIAVDYSVSANTIRRVLEEQGEKRRPADWKLPDVSRNGRYGLTQSLPAEEIIGKYRGGLSLAKLAQEYRVSVTTIRNVLKAHGQQRRSPEPQQGVSKIFSEDEQVEVVRRNQEGESLQSIADSLGISRTAVKNVLDRHSVTPSGPRSGPRQDLPMAEIAKRRAAGESAVDLAAEYGVSPATIRRRLKNVSISGGQDD